ncbi:MAG: hypothetical protein KDB07_13625, partial [Planctomycetes bacterium]|nr:hypothetical protein [Planctomycetota bacterium]
MSDLLLSPYGAFAGAVSLLWLALYFLLRRRKRARVTMAAIWQRLAAKKPKPPLRSRFKQTLSVVVGFALIFAMTLWVGGTIAPQEGTPASREPVDLVIVLDT